MERIAPSTTKPIDQQGALYQRRAFSALPLLVRQAEGGTHHPLRATCSGAWNAESSKPSVGISLLKLGRLWKQKIPPIQALVTNKSTGLPGPGFTHHD